MGLEHGLDFSESHFLEAWPCGCVLEPISFEEGHDSDVYKWNKDSENSYAIHVYTRGPKNALGNDVNPKKLHEYVTAHNDAHHLCIEAGIKIKFPYSGEEYPLRVLKFLGLQKCTSCGHYETITQYLGVRNLACFPREFDRHDLKRALQSASTVFNEILGYRGIQIDPLNVCKVGGIIVVTDLCDKIRNIQKLSRF